MIPPQHTLRPAPRTGGQGVEAVLIGAGGNDLRVKLARGIEVVVIEIEPRSGELLRLRGAEHAEGRAGLKSERAHGLDHVNNEREVLILGRAVRGSHAKARGPGVAGARGRRAHGGHVHERLALDAGVVADTLRAVGAVLRTGAGLDRQERAHLHGVRLVVAAVHLLGVEHEVREGGCKESDHLG